MTNLCPYGDLECGFALKAQYDDEVCKDCDVFDDYFQDFEDVNNHEIDNNYLRISEAPLTVGVSQRQRRTD